MQAIEGPHSNGQVDTDVGAATLEAKMDYDNPGPRSQPYLARRLRHSTLRRLFSQDGIDPHATETIVNGLALLNGLFLTVEFSLIQTLNPDYWDGLNATLAKCGQTADYWPISITLYYATLCSLVVVFLCVIFVTMLPRLDHGIQSGEAKMMWRDWWKSARWTLISIVLFTELVAGLLMALMIMLFPRIVNSSAGVCLFEQGGTRQSQIFRILTSVAIAIILVFPFLSTFMLI